jgi:hypothetical protein
MTRKNSNTKRENKKWKILCVRKFLTGSSLGFADDTNVVPWWGPNLRRSREGKERIHLSLPPAEAFQSFQPDSGCGWARKEGAEVDTDPAFAVSVI